MYHFTSRGSLDEDLLHGVSMTVEGEGEGGVVVFNVGNDFFALSGGELQTLLDDIEAPDSFEYAVDGEKDVVALSADPIADHDFRVGTRDGGHLLNIWGNQLESAAEELGLDDEPDASQYEQVVVARSHSFGAVVPISANFEIDVRDGSLIIIYDEWDDMSNLGAWSDEETGRRGAYVGSIEEKALEEVDDEILD